MASTRTREPLRGAFIAILAAAIGAGGTLLGNQLASVNSREQLSAQFSHDDSVRQSEARREVYAKFISVASQYQLDVAVAASAADAANRQSMGDRYFKKIFVDYDQLQAAWAQVQVVGSARAAELAAVIREDLSAMLNTERSPEEEISRTNAIEPKLRSFANTARDELTNQ